MPTPSLRMTLTLGIGKDAPRWQNLHGRHRGAPQSDVHSQEAPRLMKKPANVDVSGSYPWLSEGKEGGDRQGD